MSTRPSRQSPLPLLALLGAVGVACTLVQTGCGRSRRMASVAPAPEAQRLNARAVELLPTDPRRGEELLRQAVEADPFYGPAVNNLGVLALKQSKLFEAAEAFTTAARLMPGNSEPHANLGLTLERARRFDDSRRALRQALDIDPSNMVALQSLARLNARDNVRTSEAKQILVRLRDAARSPEWQAWATRQLLRIDYGDEPSQGTRSPQPHTDDSMPTKTDPS
jgi:Flp pilus assembly protein TadD